jgi:1,4-dihydroxy-2-naphthoate octaprenyltransferase
MRLPFQATLAPIFLWGWLLAGAPFTASAGLAFISLHLFLYPAATAFNSAYDRDKGPVGGIEAPPPVPDRLVGFAIALAVAGIIPATAAGSGFVVLYALSAGWTAAYSHPATRWKASPWKSSLAIALGQGVIGFTAGWAAAAPIAPASPDFIAGVLSAALTSVGLYPVTQIFQVEEDRARGDVTLAVALGPRRALRAGALAVALAGAAAAWLALHRFGTADALLVALGYAVLILLVERLARRADRIDPRAGYRSGMRLLNAATAAFLLFVGAEAALG